MCDLWSPLGTPTCPECSNELTLFAPPRTSTPPPPRGDVGTPPKPRQPTAPAPSPSFEAPKPREPRPSLDAKQPQKGTGRSGAYSFAAATKSEFADLSQEELMEQARNYVCRSCSSGVPTGHKFCGRCGTAVPIEILNAQTLFFGDMQNPAKAKLILIRGEG